MQYSHRWAKEGLEGSNAIQYLSRSLPERFPKLADVQIEIMRAHRIYSDGPKKNSTTNRTLIFNALRFTTRQAILQAARKSPLVVGGRKIRFSSDYSNYTVKRRQLSIKPWTQHESRVWIFSCFIRQL